MPERDPRQCSFCGKTEPEVQVVAGPGVYICNECVDLAAKVLEEERDQDR